MYILTQAEPFENTQNTNYTFRAPELEKEYEDAGYQKRERSYKVEYQHKEYIVCCPVFRKEKGEEPIVLIPEFLIPGRRYPVFVYLYAIDLYSSNAAMSQRAVAEATKKEFGLSTFAHTTLGRALKVFVWNTKEMENLPEESSGYAHEPAGTEKEEPPSKGKKSDERKIRGTKPRGFVCTQDTEALREQAARIFLVAQKGSVYHKGAQAYTRMALEWFLKYRRLLL